MLAKSADPQAAKAVEGVPSIFALQEPLSWKRGKALLTTRLPCNHKPRNFLVVLKDMPPFEEAKEQVIKRTQREIIEEFERIERYSLRDERKQPWGKRTREPFRGTIAGADPSFTDELGLAEQAIGRAGVPFKQRKEQRGRPYTYDRAKLGSALLAKGCRSFEDLSKDLKDIGYRLTLDGSQRWPCSSELHHFFKQLPREWLELALKELEDISKEQAQKFGESLACFGMDGSALQGERLHGLERALEELLERDFFSLHSLEQDSNEHPKGDKGTHE